MSGRQDKKSRRLQRSIAKDVDRAIKKIELSKIENKLDTLQKYNAHLKALPFWRKLKFCWALFF